MLFRSVHDQARVTSTVKSPTLVVNRARKCSGARRDIYMTSTMELRFLKDRMKVVELGITPYMGATKCWIDGTEVGFSQPEIPGVPGLHVGTITVPDTALGLLSESVDW